MFKQVSIQTFLALDHSILKVYFFLFCFQSDSWRVKRGKLVTETNQV